MSTNLTVDKNRNLATAGVLNMSGNNFLTGKRVQSVGGITLFQVDTSGNVTTNGQLNATGSTTMSNALSITSLNTAGNSRLGCYWSITSPVASTIYQN